MEGRATKLESKEEKLNVRENAVSRENILLCCYWLNAFYCVVIGRFHVRRKSRDRKSGKQKHFNFYEYLNGFANQQTLPKKEIYFISLNVQLWVILCDNIMQ